MIRLSHKDRPLGTINQIKSWLNQFFKSGTIIIVIFCFNVIILLLHLFRVPFVQVDNTTILLMVLVLLTPFASHIKKIKFGDFEAEINQEIKKAEQQAKEIKSEGEVKDQIIKKNSLIEELEELSAKDPVLALAKLIIEIEKKLKRLYTLKKLPSRA